MENIKNAKFLLIIWVVLFVSYKAYFGWNEDPINEIERKLDILCKFGVYIAVCYYILPFFKMYEYFVNKFEMKMADILPSVAAEWIDGIGELTNDQKLKVWNNIQPSLDTYSRDRQLEHGDMPSWFE